MGRRWKYGSFFVALILILLNYECSSLKLEDTNSHERKLVQESNLEAKRELEPPPKVHITYHSGTYPGMASPANNTDTHDNSTTTNSTEVTQSPVTNTTDVATPSNKGSNKWVFLVSIPVACLLMSSLVCTILIWKKKGVVVPIRPWRSGLSGPLQQAFITGVPKLNRFELEAACEEFSNIIVTHPEYTVYKGTLSSGVEISVASTSVKSTSDWSKASEMCFRKKIEMLMRINHKNFVNLLGYCEEDVPFSRMMVFEYATNGSLFEHLHVEGNEPLHWYVRMRIIMGIAYYLQHIHELEPCMAHPDLNSSLIFLSEDLAAKVGDISVWKEVFRNLKILENENNNFSEEISVDLEGNVYSFGMLLLEIITGWLPNSDDEFFLLNLALECKKETGSITTLVDPTLKSHKPEDLDVIWEVIQECTQINPQQRPKMREVTTKLNEVLAISPESASPRNSPLWWAELEILSA